ncbi:MAG: PaaI family thioesterase [Lachnospiraceae bacterium]|nr:PaaI family thioesterase [Lachnospiraceae bacterium]
MGDERLNFEPKKQIGHAQDMGMQILEASEGRAVGYMKIEERMLNPYGAIHGGVLFSLADTVGGTAALSRGFYIVTSTGTINYLRGTRASREITAIATEVKPGKTLSIYDVEMKDEHGRLVAKAVMTYYSIGVPTEKDDKIDY